MPTDEQLDAISNYYAKAEQLDIAAKQLEEAFQDYTTYINNKDYAGAKEYLRPMPESAVKVLMFRHIIMAENDVTRDGH